MSAHRILQNVSRLSMTLNRLGSQRVTLLQNQPAAFISTSKKKRDTTVAADQVQVTTSPKTAEDFANPSKKNYQHYGFERNDPEMDINIRNFVMFVTVTCAMVGGGFIMAYFPDVRFRDWNQREAYIKLAEREALGLTPIDPNVVPPEQILLPTEEELGDFDVII